MPTKDEIAEILAKPYERRVSPDVNGSFSAELHEFPGCIAMGATHEEALANLEKVAADWLTAAVLQNQEIPEPVFSNAQMVRIIIKIPTRLYQRADTHAKRVGVSLDQLIEHALLEQVRPPKPNP